MMKRMIASLMLCALGVGLAFTHPTSAISAPTHTSVAAKTDIVKALQPLPKPKRTYFDTYIGTGPIDDLSKIDAYVFGDTATPDGWYVATNTTATIGKLKSAVYVTTPLTIHGTYLIDGVLKNDDGTITTTKSYVRIDVTKTPGTTLAKDKYTSKIIVSGTAITDAQAKDIDEKAGLGPVLYIK